MKEYFQTWLDNNIHLFDNPSVYLGTEPGSESRDWDSASFKVCIIAGSTYENLTGNLAVPMITRLLLENRPNWIVERAYFPNSKTDMKLFEKHDIPVFSVESKHRLNDFDVLAFSLSFQGLDLNVIKMLSLCKIPVRTSERSTQKYPWIIRGGQNDANPCPFMPMYDLMYIGEAEVNLLKVLSLIELGTSRSISRLDLKKALTKLDGVLIPEFYKPRYEGNQFVSWEKLWDSAPYPVKVARLNDMNKGFIYKHPIVNYCESMGSGELLISRGCEARCSFCMEGNKEKPYRELEVDTVVDALKTSYKESGAISVTLSAFCTSSYNHKRTIIKRLLEEVTDEVGLTSQRVDESAGDPEFMIWSAMAGNRSVSFGVEGVSERLRALVNKWASREDILKATKNAIAAGYNKIKYFMISNLPTETDEDRKELISLAEDLRRIRDSYPEKKVQMRFNWTDLTICPWTSFQWLKPSMGSRNLSPFLKSIQSLGIRVGFGAGKGHALDSLLQLLHIGDSRLFDMLVRLVTYHDVVYFRQVPKDTFDLVVNELSKSGLDINIWWRNKKFTETLPWEIVTFGVTKRYLWNQLALNYKGKQIPKCSVLCTNCGAYGCVNRGKIESESKSIPFPRVLKRIPVDTHIVLKLNVNEKHRFVSASARKQLVRRFLYLQDIPICKDVEITSDTLQSRDWVSGVDYASVRLTQRLSEIKSLDSMCKVFDVLECRVRNTSAAKLFSSSLFCHSSLKINFPLKMLTMRLSNFLGGKDNQIKIRVEGYLGAETLSLDGKEVVKSAWITKSSDGFWLNALHSGKISIYDLYSHLTKARSWKSVAGLQAKRLDVYVDAPPLGAEYCPKCKRPYMYNVFGDRHCPQCEVKE